MPMACVLVFAAIAAAAPSRRPPHSTGPLRPQIAATANDPPRLPSGYRSRQINLRHLAPDAGAAIAEPPRRDAIAAARLRPASTTASLEPTRPLASARYARVR